MSNDLIQVMKKAALQVYEESSPSGIFFGKVISTAPLKIQIEQRLTLEAQHLVLTSLVNDFDIDMTVDNIKKPFKVHLGLKIDETVTLLRVQGGQKYIVLDRVRGE